MILQEGGQLFEVAPSVGPTQLGGVPQMWALLYKRFQDYYVLKSPKKMTNKDPYIAVIRIFWKYFWGDSQAISRGSAGVMRCGGGRGPA